jgi:hypothetical protein
VDLPEPAGPLSGVVVGTLRDTVGVDEDVLRAVRARMPGASEAWASVDLQLALACCYELHYGGFADVHDDREWDVGVLAVRQLLEARFLESVRQLVGLPPPDDRPVPEVLRDLVAADQGPSLSSYLLRQADAEQFRDFLRQRSVYQLKEADPHTWAIPRLQGRAKVALAEIQADEYGGGRPEAMHAALFASSMRALGLDDTYGAYWSQALPEMLAVVNLMSLLALHRRWRGAAAGHLAALEMTSTGPNRRYGNGLRRLGFGRDATHYFDEHVEADAVHEQVAAVDLCGGLVDAEPALRGDVLLGARACLAVEGLFSRAMLTRWGALDRVRVG